MHAEGMQIPSSGVTRRIVNFSTSWVGNLELDQRYRHDARKVRAAVDTQFHRQAKFRCETFFSAPLLPAGHSGNANRGLTNATKRGPGGLVRLGRSPAGRSHNCYDWDRLTILKNGFPGVMLAASSSTEDTRASRAVAARPQLCLSALPTYHYDPAYGPGNAEDEGERSCVRRRTSACY